MTRGTLPLDWRGGPLPSCHFHISLWTNLCGQTPTKHQAARLPKIRAALRQSNRPESSIFTGLNPLQPKPAFSSLDHVPLAPAAEFWAVRSGPPVSEALARSAGSQVSALRASADRCAVVCEILDPTFCFSLCWSLVLLVSCCDRVNCDLRVWRGHQDGFVRRSAGFVGLICVAHFNTEPRARR